MQPDGTTSGRYAFVTGAGRRLAARTPTTSTAGRRSGASRSPCRRRRATLSFRYVFAHGPSSAADSLRLYVEDEAGTKRTSSGTSTAPRRRSERRGSQAPGQPRRLRPGRRSASCSRRPTAAPTAWSRRSSTTSGWSGLRGSRRSPHRAGTSRGLVPREPHRAPGVRSRNHAGPIGRQPGGRCDAANPIRRPAGPDAEGGWPSASPAAALAIFLAATPALACGGLIGPNGAVNLLRTTTFAGYHDGVEHYVTAFQFAGGGGAVRLDHPAARHPDERREGRRLDAPAPDPRDEPARDLDVAAGGVRAGGRRRRGPDEGQDRRPRHHRPQGRRRATSAQWATAHGFRLPPDAPEVLDFYAQRSPIFLAAAFDADAAKARGQQVGDGTPVHITIPTANPWVPLRILALGKTGGEPVQADVYLLTDHAPALLPAPTGVERHPPRRTAQRASDGLLTDLRSDRGHGLDPVVRLADEGRGRRDRRASSTTTSRSTRPAPAGRRRSMPGSRCHRRRRRPATPVDLSRLLLALGFVGVGLVGVGLIGSSRAGTASRRLVRMRRRAAGNGSPAAGDRAMMHRTTRASSASAFAAVLAVVDGHRRERGRPRERPDRDPDHDPLLALRPGADHRPGRPAGDVRDHEHGPDRPRVDRRRRRPPRAPPDRHRAGPQRPADRDHDPGPQRSAGRRSRSPQPGTLQYICHLPGHEAYGMVGVGDASRRAAEPRARSVGEPPP